MAAGLGFKTFTTGEVLTAADVNGYLMQGVLVFATEAARNSAITSPQEGQFAFTKDTNSLWYYSGSAWVASGATGDIEGITTGTDSGLSGGVTSGTAVLRLKLEFDAETVVAEFLDGDALVLGHPRHIAINHRQKDDPLVDDLVVREIVQQRMRHRFRIADQKDRGAGDARRRILEQRDEEGF